MSNSSRAQDLLTKSSYCRNSKHAKCKTAGCECKCHQPNTEVPSPTIDAIIENVEQVQVEQRDHSATENAVIAAEAAAELESVRAEVFRETGCGGCDNGEDCGAGCTDAAITAARQTVLDRLDPAKAPAPAPVPAKKVKAPKQPKPVVKGTVDGKLSNAHKRAIREQMVAYLGAMTFTLDGDLEGVTPDEAAAYVDQYWVKYIDPARDKARHSK